MLTILFIISSFLLRCYFKIRNLLYWSLLVFERKWQGRGIDKRSLWHVFVIFVMLWGMTETLRILNDAQAGYFIIVFNIGFNRFIKKPKCCFQFRDPNILYQKQTIGEPSRLPFYLSEYLNCEFLKIHNCQLNPLHNIHSIISIFCYRTTENYE